MKYRLYRTCAFHWVVWSIGLSGSRIEPVASGSYQKMRAFCRELNRYYGD